ncbi:hypothetical protein BDN71DRAFT_1427195 [Pleurotus eryngii]|uniref:Uncharacterized protein n=1 Tax=Pleurotus eryngii TaxID=5323 RepID=A0A9P6AB58_PLEER|nr:hypothetical protein BDN71DRAFT_1427195 [Pleurotus eryngii]
MTQVVGMLQVTAWRTSVMILCTSRLGAFPAGQDSSSGTIHHLEPPWLAISLKYYIRLLLYEYIGRVRRDAQDLKHSPHKDHRGRCRDGGVTVRTKGNLMYIAKGIFGVMSKKGVDCADCAARPWRHVWLKVGDGRTRKFLWDLSHFIATAVS